MTDKFGFKCGGTRYHHLLAKKPPSAINSISVMIRVSFIPKGDHLSNSVEFNLTSANAFFESKEGGGRHTGGSVSSGGLPWNT